jgi:TetR/AcrR family transcriptional repressor of bet genes
VIAAPLLPLATLPATRRARRKAPADRRQDLLAAAIACLARLGPRGATGREVCRQAGVSHGLLRHYFETPEALFAAAYGDLCDRFVAEFEARLTDAALSPDAALDAFFAVQFSEAWANPDVLGAWFAYWTLTRTDPAFAAVNAAYNQRLRALIERALGRLNSDFDRGSASSILASVMDGLWLETCLRPDPAGRAEAERLCRLTLRALAGAVVRI